MLDSVTQQTTLDSLAEEVISYYKKRDFSPQHFQRFARHVEEIRQFLTEN